MGKQSVHIGSLIKRVLEEKRIPVSEFAAMAHTDRSNMYRFLNRENIDLVLLNRYCRLLDHDFFKDLSDNYQKERSKSLANAKNKAKR
ncbi:MAG: helix-turn-helix domain-containing protein [Bacteroidales bacterium]|nr:helix-turn-helix domain-containing protein [Bacteroidales bacterium]